jgi:hemolysin activation/secretion protein
MQTVKGLVRSFQTSGNSETASLEIKNVIHRNQTTKTALNSSITLKSAESYLEDVKTDTSSRKLSVLKAGISHNRRLFNGIAYFDLNYYKGLKNFAAQEDSPDINADAPKAQFQKYDFGITYNKPFALFNQNAIWQTNFFSQYSPDVLFGTEKINIGDSATVRGFKEDSIQGDKGFYLKNEIIFKNPQSPIFKGLLSKSDLFFGIDTGYVRETAGVEANYGEGKGGLTGWAFGLRYNNDPFAFDITYSKPIYSPHFIEENDYQIYFSVTVGLDNILDKAYNHIFDKKK